MAATFSAASFDSRALTTCKRARAANARLRWAVLLMVLLNAAVWGGMIAVMQGFVAVDHFGVRLISW